MAEQVSVMEQIISSCAVELFNEWSQHLPDSERTDEKLKQLSDNASATTFFLIQLFMEKFNNAAEQLKSIDTTEEIQ